MGQRQPAAVQGDALTHPGQRPRRHERPVVADVDLQHVGPEAHGHVGAARAADIERCGERLLDDAVRRHVEPGRELARLALDAHGDGEAGGGRPARERLDVAQRRLGRERQLRVLGAQDPEQPAQLVQRFAPGALDRLEGGLREVRPREREPARARGLHGHPAQRVGDHVVQLARDPRALVDHGAAGGVRAPALEQRGPLAQGAVQRRAAAQQAADQDRRADRDREREEHAGERDVVVVGDGREHPERQRQRDPGGELLAPGAQAEPEGRDERHRERQQQVLVVLARQRGQQRDRAEDEHDAHERRAPAVDEADRHRAEQQRGEAAVRGAGRDQQRQLGPELDRQGAPEEGGKARAHGGQHAGKSDVRLPVCPRTQERSRPSSLRMTPRRPCADRQSSSGPTTRDERAASVAAMKSAALPAALLAALKAGLLPAPTAPAARR